MPRPSQPSVRAPLDPRLVEVSNRLLTKLEARPALYIWAGEHIVEVKSWIDAAIARRLPKEGSAPVPFDLDPVEYRYGLPYRPAGKGHTPPGIVRIDPPIPSYPEKTRHGVAVYRYPLTDAEVRTHYLARYLPASQVEYELYSLFRIAAADGAEEQRQRFVALMRENRAVARQAILARADLMGLFFSNVELTVIVDRVIDQLIEDIG